MKYDEEYKVETFGRNSLWFQDEFEYDNHSLYGMRDVTNYFIMKGFKIIEANEEKVVATIGNSFTNYITNKMSKVKRKIQVGYKDGIMIVTTNVDAKGQMITPNEIRFWPAEINEIKEYLTTSKLSGEEMKVYRKSEIKNFWGSFIGILAVPLGILILTFVILTMLGAFGETIPM